MLFVLEKEEKEGRMDILISTLHLWGGTLSRVAIRNYQADASRVVQEIEGQLARTQQQGHGWDVSKAYLHNTVKEEGRERERQREKERQRDRVTERQSDRE